MTIIMFPGQGSQGVGMGAELFDRYPTVTSLASDMAEFDIKEICLNGTEEDLSMTNITQVVVYVVNHLHYLAWRDDKMVAPTTVVGHSVGQFNAMVVAKMMSFDSGLHLIKNRGKIMADQKGGAMAAVLKIDADEIDRALISAGIDDQVSVANYNSEQQNVLAMKQDLLPEVSAVLGAAGAFVVPLKTSGAFHSPYMLEASQAFSRVLDDVEFHASRVELLCNTTAQKILNPSQALAEHLISPVKWKQTIYQIMSSRPGMEFFECGYGGTLSNILRYNSREYSQIYAVDKAG